MNQTTPHQDNQIAAYIEATRIVSKASTLEIDRNLYDILLDNTKGGRCGEHPLEISDIIYWWEHKSDEPIPDLRFTIRGFEKPEDIVGDVPICAQVYREGRWSQAIIIAPAIEGLAPVVGVNVTAHEKDRIVEYLQGF